jgi:hypothetical protein
MDIQAATTGGRTCAVGDRLSLCAREISVKLLLRQYIVDPREVSWKSGQTEGITFQCQVFLSGADGGPEALRFRFDPCPRVYAHMHLTSQFQLLLGGTMDFPKATMKLRPVAVHYADHNLPYGPFSTGEGHDMLVLHPRQGGLVTMADRTARRQIYLAGRQLVGMDREREWLPAAGLEGVRCKFLLPPGSGPQAIMLECPCNCVIAAPVPTFGRYEVVLSGSAVFSGKPVEAPGLRYVAGDEEPTPIRCGPAGASLILLSFDEDAMAGGLGDDQLSRSAAEAIERAI